MLMNIINRINALKVLNQHIVLYPTPSNLSYMYNWGSLAGIVLVIQIVTGILLAMHYVPETAHAFNSVVHIMNDVPGGMILRYTHSNGASLFFAVVYMHVLRGLYYNSFTIPRDIVWIVGVITLLLMIITAFIGYCLVWGQMSLWGATVITSLLSVIPVVGNTLVNWLWGGFSIDQPTLNRFYSLHYTLPFVLVALSVVHIASLHQYGSSNPLGVNGSSNTIQFGLYYTLKDALGVVILLLAYAILVLFYPEVLGHPDNLIPANPYSTPQHIVPEWYFLWVYAVLRSIPNKAAGVIAIALIFVGLILLPYTASGHLGSPKFRGIYEKLFWIIVADLFLLTWVGAQEIMPSTILLGQICTLVLFAYLYAILPFVGLIENSITQNNIKPVATL